MKNYRSRNRKIFGYTGRTATRWVLTVLVGLTTAVVAKGLIFFIDELSHLRTHRLNEAQGKHGRGLIN
jgi:hypothetical protein